ncbi:hypothetical protein JHV666_49420 [Mycobacterium avium subsp. hominissuis]
MSTSSVVSTPSACTCARNAASSVDSAAAFRAQVQALGVDTTLLVDTYDVTTGSFIP